MLMPSKKNTAENESSIQTTKDFGTGKKHKREEDVQEVKNRPSLSGVKKTLTTVTQL